MARSFNLPYKSSNPRTVRGAKKRGWYVIDVPPIQDPKLSWLGLCVWADRSLKGHFVNSFHLRQFAFEQGADAVAFKLKWV
jgi:hypothetical protein